MKMMLRPKLEELADNATALTVMFYLEISSFMAAGYSLARMNLVFAVLYLILGFLIAFTVGEALIIKGEGKRGVEGIANEFLNMINVEDKD